MLDIYDLFEIATDFLFDDILGYIKNEKKSKLARFLLIAPLGIISVVAAIIFVFVARTDHWLLMFFSGLLAFYLMVRFIQLAKIILRKDKAQPITSTRGY